MQEVVGSIPRTIFLHKVFFFFLVFAFSLIHKHKHNKLANFTIFLENILQKTNSNRFLETKTNYDQTFIFQNLFVWLPTKQQIQVSLYQTFGMTKHNNNKCRNNNNKCSKQQRQWAIRTMTIYDKLSICWVKKSTNNPLISSPNQQPRKN